MREQSSTKYIEHAIKKRIFSLPFSFLSVLFLFKLAANSLTDLFSILALLKELAVLLVDNVGGKEAGPLTPLSVDSSRASPESGVFPAEVFGLEPSLNKLNSPKN